MSVAQSLKVDLLLLVWRGSKSSIEGDLLAVIEPLCNNDCLFVCGIELIVVNLLDEEFFTSMTAGIKIEQWVVWGYIVTLI